VLAPGVALTTLPTPSLPAVKVSTDLSTVLRSAKPVTLSLPAPAASTSRGTYSLSRQLGLGVSRIVIDPGHGGHDPGAQANGIDEAELVLDVALRLEALLKSQPGQDIVLTRRTDQYVALEERTAIANREGADLFLSIHANAAKDPLLRGIETYFLNFASNPTAEAVAARENATGAKTMGNLPELVKAITLNNKVAESRELAGLVQSSMTTELSVKNKAVRDLGVKQAPFVVLIGAQMPSVLAEISFVTNRGDATFLKTAAYRQGIAQALFDAVSKYQMSLKHSTSAAAKDRP
jgi:N-acetylmuramoyl-L-alanine amidase